MRFVPSMSAVSLLLLSPAAVLAHTGVDHGAHHDLGAGFLHPLTGLDHVLMLLAVGMWCSQLRRGARWTAAMIFPLMMVAGGIALTPMHLAAPIVEGGVIASIAVVGLLLAWSLRMPAWAACAFIGCCATLHGYAHFAEMPADASIATYAAGFAIASAALVVLGLMIGRLCAARRQLHWLRISGGAVVVAAGVLAMV